jgi:hypothetical protein
LANETSWRVIYLVFYIKLLDFQTQRVFIINGPFFWFIVQFYGLSLGFTVLKKIPNFDFKIPAVWFFLNEPVASFLWFLIRAALSPR